MSHQSLWRDRTFLRLWGSDAVSQTGTQISLLALPLAAVVALHASAGQVALLAAAGTAPYLIVGLPAGVWIDRFERRRVMVVADLVRFVLLATLPLAWALDVLTFAHLAAVAFFAGVATVFFDVAFLASVPMAVPAGRLADANTNFEATRAIAQVSGPGLAGVLVQLLTAPVAIGADALSYAVSAVLLADTPRTRVNAEGPSRGLLGEMGEGVRFVARHPIVRPLTLSSASINLFHSGFTAIFLVDAVRRLGLSPGAVGAALALSNVGYLLGSLAAKPLNRRFGLGPTVVVAAAGQPGLLLVPFAPVANPWPFIVAGLAISAASSGLYNVNAVSLRQAATPPEMLGRMTATSRFAIWGTMPLGAALAGLAVTLIGMHATLVIGAAGTGSGCLVLALSAVRFVRELPGEPVVISGSPAHSHGEPVGVPG
jgi:MFS family permease